MRFLPTRAFYLWALLSYFYGAPYYGFYTYHIIVFIFLGSGRNPLVTYFSYMHDFPDAKIRLDICCPSRIQPRTLPSELYNRKISWGYCHDEDSLYLGTYSNDAVLPTCLSLIYQKYTHKLTATKANIHQTFSGNHHQFP